MSTTSEVKGLPIKRFPLDLKAALIARAEREGSNFNDVAVAILAAAFSVPFQPNGRRGAGADPANDYVNLDMPARLKRKIAVAAAGAGVAQAALVIEKLRAATA